METQRISNIETKVIPFPRELDTTFIKITQKKAELNARENRARNYSVMCEAKRANKSKLIDMDDVACFVSALSVFAFVAAMYFVGIVFM